MYDHLYQTYWFVRLLPNWFKDFFNEHATLIWDRPYLHICRSHFAVEQLLAILVIF